MTDLAVSALTRYPLKSGRGEALAFSDVETLGLAGDRRWMIVDAEGQSVTAREHPRLLLVAAVLLGDGIRLSAAGHGEVFAAAPAERAPVSS